MPTPLSKGFIVGLRPENCSATSCFLFQLFLSFNNYSLIVLCDKISVLKHSPSGLLTIKDPDLPAHSVKLKIKAPPQKGFNAYHIGRGLPPAQPLCNISIWGGGCVWGVVRTHVGTIPFRNISLQDPWGGHFSQLLSPLDEQLGPTPR